MTFLKSYWKSTTQTTTWCYLQIRCKPMTIHEPFIPTWRYIFHGSKSIREIMVITRLKVNIQGQYKSSIEISSNALVTYDCLSSYESNYLKY